MYSSRTSNTHTLYVRLISSMTASDHSWQLWPYVPFTVFSLVTPFKWSYFSSLFLLINKYCPIEPIIKQTSIIFFQTKSNVRLFSLLLSLSLSLKKTPPFSLISSIQLPNHVSLAPVILVCFNQNKICKCRVNDSTYSTYQLLACVLLLSQHF